MTGPGPARPGPARPGKIVIGTLGLDQHEVGAMAISRILVRHGYDVIYLGRFNTPQRLAAAAEQEDADLIGVSIHSWEYTAYADELLARCRDLGIGLVLGGSVLTERDQAALRPAGPMRCSARTRRKPPCCGRSRRSSAGSGGGDPPGQAHQPGVVQHLGRAGWPAGSSSSPARPAASAAPTPWSCAGGRRRGGR